MKKKILSMVLAASMLTGIGMAVPMSAIDKAPELAPNEPPAEVANNLAATLPNDVKDQKNEWYFGAVKTINDIGYMTGKAGADAGNWKPMDQTTRAEMAKILRCVAGLTEKDIEGKGENSKFTDIKDNWAANDIAWAAEMGIVKGRSDEIFAPQSSITRAEIATMFVRAIEKLDINLSENIPLVDSFADVDGHWATEEGTIEAARVGGLISGKRTDADGNNYFEPDEQATRAEIATMLTRYGMDPMHYALSNIRNFVPTESTRPILQFGRKSEMTLEAINKILLPQLGLDSETYTMVVPDYQLAEYTYEEENRYMEKKIDKETGEWVKDEEGNYMYASETCGCNSAKCTNVFGGLGGNGGLDDSRCLFYYYFAIKNKKTGEMTNYAHIECKVVKLKTAVDDDAAYVGLKNRTELTGYARTFDKADFAQILLTGCEVNDCLGAEDMPEKYAYSVIVPENEMKAMIDAFNSLKDNGSQTDPITVHVTLKNRASGAEAVGQTLQVVLVKDSKALNPYGE